MLLFSDDFVTTLRVFDVLVFSLAGGFALSMAILLKKTETYRRYFLASFGLMCIGVMAGTIGRIHAGSPWNWAVTPFIFLSSVFVVVTLVEAYREIIRKK